jgi:hypothetical protein
MEPGALVGRWGLWRRVRDGGAYGAVVGELVVSPSPDGLRWDERGVLRFGGGEFPVTRTYLLRDGAVWFADGRFFHPWRPGEVVTHPCGEDVYTGLVTVDGDRMRTVWDVVGPRKRQRLVTRFARLP